MTTSTVEAARSSGAARMLAVAVSVTGILIGSAVLVLTWTATDTALVERLNRTSYTGSSLLMLGLALLIALRAGAEAANVSIALSTTFVFFSGIIDDLLITLNRNQGVPAESIRIVLYFLGAALYIRATQLFPRRISSADIISSPTLWGRVQPFRRVLITLLDARVAWLAAAVLTLVTFPAFGEVAAQAARLGVILIGAVYMYVIYRSGDEESSRKVLWFFEAAVVALVFGLLVLGIRGTVGGSLSDTSNAVLKLSLNTLYSLTLVVCFGAAVFYAGAVSPALVVRRTVVYGATVAMLLFTFATVQSLVTDAIVDFFGVTDRLGSAMVGTIFGLAFHPLKQRTEHLLRKPGAKQSVAKS